MAEGPHRWPPAETTGARPDRRPDRPAEGSTRAAGFVRRVGRTETGALCAQIEPLLALNGLDQPSDRSHGVPRTAGDAATARIRRGASSPLGSMLEGRFPKWSTTRERGIPRVGDAA